MQFGKALGTACSTFAVTNIDDLFVLVTFFTESSVNKNLTPLKIAIGQYVGFTVIIIISMIGFGVAQAISSEPIGFLGLLPIMMGVWGILALIFPPGPDEEEEEEVGNVKAAGIRSILKVASITIMNGGDNIGTYIPLFSQAEGTEIAVYVVTYYVLLGVWFLVAFLIMKQKRIVEIAQKYARVVVPLLYVGLGIFIVIKSHCYPWSIERIDERFLGGPGKAILGTLTAIILALCISTMVWFRMRKRAANQHTTAGTDVEFQREDTIRESGTSRSGLRESDISVAGIDEKSMGGTEVLSIVESKGR
ncbi:hypothetical protein TWF481_008191 [Arthrobotrys musiformis]|uniref:Cadmium resistance transporter n=1 Tax=Arthrobotrys musiformis TaxID=47236 RepID=A0AAV9WC62_9PEZI